MIRLLLRDWLLNIKIIGNKMLTLRICCIALLASFATNIYLTYLIQSSLTENRCLEMGLKFANEHYQHSPEVDAADVLVSTAKDIAKQHMQIGEDKSVVKTDENDIYPEHQNSLFSERRGLVRHCITDEILGAIPNTTQTVKFSLTNAIVTESAHERLSSFQKVFINRSWGRDWDSNYKGLSASGRGSTLYYAQNVIGILHKVINDIKKLKGNNAKVKIMDVPCGDFVWMSRFLSTRDDIDYTGMDIVKELVDHHKNAYKNKDWKFVHGDIVDSHLTEKYDIILCRMLLQHLYASDAKKVLQVFSENSGGLLLTTTFSSLKINKDLNVSVDPGRYRKLNLEIPPYSLQPPICISRDGMANDVDPDVFLGLWELPLRKIRRCKNTYRIKPFDVPYFSCVNWTLNKDVDKRLRRVSLNFFIL